MATVTGNDNILVHQENNDHVDSNNMDNTDGTGDATGNATVTTGGAATDKMLNRLQEIMNTFDFDIVYKKGSKMPADYLSGNLFIAISWDASTLQQAQNADPLLRALKNFLLKKELP
jgi:hypothetical protein